MEILIFLKNLCLIKGFKPVQFVISTNEKILKKKERELKVFFLHERRSFLIKFPKFSEKKEKNLKFLNLNNGRVKRGRIKKNLPPFTINIPPKINKTNKENMFLIM